MGQFQTVYMFYTDVIIRNVLIRIICFLGPKRITCGIASKKAVKSDRKPNAELLNRLVTAVSVLGMDNRSLLKNR